MGLVHKPMCQAKTGDNFFRLHFLPHAMNAQVQWWWQKAWLLLSLHVRFHVLP